MSRRREKVSANNASAEKGEGSRITRTMPGALWPGEALGKSRQKICQASNMEMGLESLPRNFTLTWKAAGNCQQCRNNSTFGKFRTMGYQTLWPIRQTWASTLWHRPSTQCNALSSQERKSRVADLFISFSLRYKTRRLPSAVVSSSWWEN